MSSSLRRSLAFGTLPLLLCLASCSGSADSGASATAGSPAVAGSSPSGSASPTSSGALDSVQVAGGSATVAPKVTIPSPPLSVTSTQSRVVKAGSGADITADTKVDVNYLLINGRDGQTRESAWGPSKTQSVAVGSVPQFASLVGQKVGAQVLIAMPAKEAYPPQGANAELKINADDTVIFLIAPVAAHEALTQAQGTPVAPKASLPAVAMGATAKDPATFTLPKGVTPPPSTIAQPLIIGSGPKVVAGQTVRVSYTGVTWRDPNTPFDYSGKTETHFVEFPVGQGRLIKAWDEHLVGQTVGTRLLLVVPPADGYGSAGQGDAIKGTDTLIFVVDILAAD